MVGGTEARNGRQVFRAAVAAVPFPPIPPVPARQPVHQPVADRLGDDAGCRDGVAIGVAVDQGVVCKPDFRHAKAVDEQGGQRGSGAAGQDLENRTAHGEGGRHANVQCVDFADRGAADADGEGGAPDLEREGLPPGR